MRYTVDQAAKAVSKSPRTVRRWIAAGLVEAEAMPGKLGPRYSLTRQHLDQLRTFAARDAEPGGLVAEPAAEPAEQQTAALSQLAPAPAPALDLAGLVGAVAAAITSERQAVEHSAGQQLDAERRGHAATIAAMRAQLDAERRRADDAADSTAHARALLDDALALVAELRRQLNTARQATTTRATQPIDRAALALVGGRTVAQSHE
jgi:Skp family chaperone for outer membrane proteins